MAHLPSLTLLLAVLMVAPGMAATTYTADTPAGTMYVSDGVDWHIGRF